MISDADGALQLHIEDRVARLLLNRPQARNAVNFAMWTALPAVLGELSRDPGVRVVVMSGAGGDFASGADIAEFPTIFADHASALAYGARIEAATRAVAQVNKPVIAAIEGWCLGAGLAIALACDMRLAARGSRLGAPPAKLGLMYSLADSRRLMQAVGVSAARNMLFTAVAHPADEALRLGLVDEVHAPEAFESAVAAKAQAIASLSPWSVRHAKTVLGLVLDGATEDSDATREWFADAVEGPDFAEGMAAFRGRRPPRFSG